MTRRTDTTVVAYGLEEMSSRAADDAATLRRWADEWLVTRPTLAKAFVAAAERAEVTSRTLADLAQEWTR